jgi:DNA (cytosine-5)-methyltransferase 1
VFASEIDPHVRKFLKAKYGLEGKRLFVDVTVRKGAPGCDFYSSGPPCQPFSFEGKNEGLKCENGKVFLNCLVYIKTSLPKVFVLENVASLTSPKHVADFNLILAFLRNIKDTAGRPVYRVTYKILNTLQFGLAQSRKRLFIVGLRSERKTKVHHRHFHNHYHHRSDHSGC